MRTILYPGSFDPFTNGHLDLVERASRLFDEVIVAVAVNPGKNPMFSLKEREALIDECCCHLSNVRVVSFQGLVVDAVDFFQAQAVLRGLRAFSDFEYEMQMAQMNNSLYDEIETVFLVPKSKYNFISSSIVKEVSRLGGDINKFVTAPVGKSLTDYNNKN